MVVVVFWVVLLMFIVAVVSVSHCEMPSFLRELTGDLPQDAHI